MRQRTERRGHFFIILPLYGIMVNFGKLVNFWQSTHFVNFKHFIGGGGRVRCGGFTLCCNVKRWPPTAAHACLRQEEILTWCHLLVYETNLHEQAAQQTT